MLWFKTLLILIYWKFIKKNFWSQKRLLTMWAYKGKAAVTVLGSIACLSREQLRTALVPCIQWVMNNIYGTVIYNNQSLISKNCKWHYLINLLQYYDAFSWHLFHRDVLYSGFSKFKNVTRFVSNFLITCVILCKYLWSKLFHSLRTLL